MATTTRAAEMTCALEWIIASGLVVWAISPWCEYIEGVVFFWGVIWSIGGR